MGTDRIVLNSDQIDYSRLVGREIRLRTEQFPGHLLVTRVLAVADNNLVIDRSGSGGRIDQLIANQKTEVLFDYKGEPVVFTSLIVIPHLGRLQIPLSGEVQPQLRRQFVRLNLAHDVRLTFFDDTNIGFVRLNRLKWLETSTQNISGGGMLVKIPAFVGSEGFLVMHLGLEGVSLPKLMVGRVRHRQPTEESHAQVGVEFVIRENCAERFPKNLLRNLPLKLFDFDYQKRAALAQFLAENHEGISIEGKLI